MSRLCGRTLGHYRVGRLLGAGEHYFTMELVSGRMLSDAIPKDGLALSVREGK